MDENKFAKGSTSGSRGLLWQMLGASMPVLAGSVLAGLVAGGSNAGLLTLINFSLGQDRGAASSLAPAFFGLCVLVLLSSALSQTLLSRMAQAKLFDLRLWLSRRILAAPLCQLQRCGAHRLMAALTDDIGGVVMAQEGLPVLFIEGAKLVAALAYLGWLSPSLLLLSLAFLFLGLVGFWVPQEWAWRWLKSAREADDALFGHFRAITEGCKELKMNARRRRAFLDQELRGTADLIRTRRNKAWLIFVLADRWGQLLYFLVIGTVLFLPSIAGQVPRETLIGYTLVILFLAGPISVIVHNVPLVGRGFVALRNIEALGLAMTAEQEADAAGDTEGHWGNAPRLELSGVSHLHQGEDGERGFRLGPIDLRIEPGELIFVTGGNGSGKTTLGLLILGLHPPDMGEIRLGGRPVTDENRDAYRQNFAVVFADAFVFQSLLGYSSEDLRLRAEELLVMLELDRKLRIENGRFSTIELSRGQRKRLALLSAYLEDRPFYLFDEWAAEQDPVFREIFYTELLPALKARGKAVIVITHDDRYFHLADRLLRLTMGRMEEQRRTGEACHV